MSKFLILLATLFLASFASARSFSPSPSPSYRLLSTSPSLPPFWVAPEAAEALGSTDFDFIDITDFQDADPSLAPLAAPLPTGPSRQSTVLPLLEKIDITRYEALLTTMSAFRNRYYTSQHGLDSATWLLSQVEQAAGNRSDVTVTKFANTWQQFSIIARIEGTSSSEDIVILGAHQDSTAPGMPSGTAPGADDDASGSIGILEIFRILVESNFRPQYPIEFHWYSAEEVGLLGSQAIAQSYQARAEVIRGMMQLDMIAYDGKESTVGIVTDYVDAETIAFNRKLVDEYLNIGWTNTVCGYGCSDHASWDRYGYRASFPFEAQFSNRNMLIHTAQDLLSRISMEHAHEFVKLGLSFAVELSYL